MELDHVADVSARMVSRKAAVIGGMPILGCDDEVKARLQAVDEGNKFLSAGDGKGAAFHEIVLEIHDDERVHSSKLKPFFFSCRYLASSKR